MSSPGEIVVEPMTRKHITELMRYERLMFGTESWSAAAYRDELADHANRFYRAAIDEAGALQGWAGLRIVGAEAEVLTVGVIPTARKRGIGTALLAALLDEARRREVAEVFLDVRFDNDDAQRIYRREGFVEVGRRRGYYDHGRVDSLTMKLELAGHA
jgi:ribosomal-protein-alanine N-acetyltransferase